MLPIYHDADNDEIGGARAEQMNAKRQALAKAVVIAEGQLAVFLCAKNTVQAIGTVEGHINNVVFPTT